MGFSSYQKLVLSDLHRIQGRTGIGFFLKQMLIGESFKFLFWMRTCRYTADSFTLKVLFHPLARVMYRHYKIKFGLAIPYQTSIQHGFMIGHIGHIVVNSGSVIGKNCNLSHGVTLGRANRGRNKGCPVIGDNVYIGPGAKIVGGVKIGDNVAVGANCVVTRDVPAGGVVVGIPGKVISDSGSEGYINNTDYE